MVITHLAKKVFLSAIFLYSAASALDTVQVFRGYPEREEYVPGVDTFWLGATMYTQVDNDSIFVQFVYSAAWWANVLYFMNPVTGDTQRVFGFDQNNQYDMCPVNPSTGQVEIKKYIGSFPRNTELVFMLRTVRSSSLPGSYCSHIHCGPRFTGLNNPLKSTYYSSKTPWGGPQYAQFDNHAWAIMAEMDSAQIARIPHPCPDRGPLGRGAYRPTQAKYGVIFAYEDGADETYDDMIFLVLNAKLSPVDKVEITVDADTIVAGSSTQVHGNVYLNNAIDPALSQRIIWSIVPPLSPGDALSQGSGATTTFTATRAYRTVKIVGSFYDANYNIWVRDTAEIYIKPGPPDHLVIESAIPSGAGLNSDQPLTVVTLGSGVASYDNVYAILRDRYGNYCFPDSFTTWTTVPAGDSYVGVSVLDRNRGRGRITKLVPPPQQYTTTVRATSSKYGFSDDVLVRLDPAVYTELRITDASRTPLTVLNTNTETATLLVVQARREDGVWVDYTGVWSITPVSFRTANPPSGASVVSWNFAPLDTGSGIRVGVSSGGMSAYITVNVSPGPPRRLVFYSRPGDPLGVGNRELPRSMNLSADSSLSIYAKIFDGSLPSVWLRNYEENGALAAQIRWAVIDSGGLSGVLSASQGAMAVYTPRVAGRTVQIVAWLSGTVLSDTIAVRILPGSPAVLEITQDTISKIPSGTEVRFDRSDTAMSLYSVLRDRNGNYLGFAYNANWLSRNNAVVSAVTGNVAYGEGVLHRTTREDSWAWVVASLPIGGGVILYDSVQAVISAAVYDPVRIYVLRSGVKAYIDTLSVRVGSSEILYVEGVSSLDRQAYPLNARWYSDAAMIANGAASVTLTPTAPGTVWIKADYRGVRDSVRVTYLPGVPNAIAVYPATGNPSSMQPYPPSNTVTAGTLSNLVAKVFYNTEWFAQYEQDSAKKYFSWTVTRLSGAADVPMDSLSARAGYQTQFRPIRAFTTYRVTVTFTGGGTNLTTSLNIAVTADTAASLVVEADPDNYHPNLPRPFDPITFNARESVKYGFALLRDRYGNFAGYSYPTVWTSLDQALVTAREGAAQPQKGEGQISRAGDVGQTRVIARNSAKAFLVDTVVVILSDVSYDALRIVVGDSTDITTLSIAADRDTVLRVLGLRSRDNAWVPVDGAWIFTPAGLAPNPGATSSFTFTPSVDTAHGSIIVTYPGATPDTVRVTVTPGAPTRLTLYPRGGAPGLGGNIPYPDSVIDSAGQWLPLVAKIFFRSVWLADYELPARAAEFAWLAIDSLGGADSAGDFRVPGGDSAAYRGVMAGRTTRIIARLGALTDTLRVRIVPGRPYQLTLEADAQAHPNRAEPADTVVITNAGFTARAYAIVRDSIGNFIGYSRQTLWGFDIPPLIVSVRGGNADIGEGVITKDTAAVENLTRIYAVDKATGLRDSAYVRLLRYHYLALRIEADDGFTFQHLSHTTPDTLRITTNDIAALRVKGQRSDDTTLWEPVAAQWELAAGLRTETPAPGSAERWRFSPAAPGRGWIRVSLDDSLTRPDTLRVIFDVGPPTSVTIRILTPPERLIAGEPITAVVTIRNQDGPAPGRLCFTSIYQDTLGSGGRDSLPQVIVDDSTLLLNQRPSVLRSSRECFDEGYDTVTFVLYYAPADPDSLHQLFARIVVGRDTLTAATDAFRLMPARVDSIALRATVGTGRINGDSVLVISPTGWVNVTAQGYDRFGNPVRGNDNAYHWTTTGSLHPTGQSRPLSWVYYTTLNVRSDEQGYLIAAWSGDTSVSARLWIDIMGPRASMSATTADTNGNGYLDRMVIRFTMPVEFLDSLGDPDLLNRWIIIEGRDTLRVVGMQALDTLGMTYALILEEKRTPGPQTDWTPAVRFDNADGAIRGAAAAIRLDNALDGAGPVVWRVVKTINNVDDRTQDMVRVEFSESILDSATGAFRVTSATPASLFDVWVINADSILTPVAGLLEGIAGFSRVDEAYGLWVEFYMENGSTLNESHRLSIRVDTLIVGADTQYVAELIDRQHNYPAPGNDPVRVEVKGKLGERMVIGPNPFPPSLRHQEDELTNHAPEVAMRWALYEGGTVISIKVAWSSDIDRITGSLQVYDLAGNLVYSRKNAKDLARAEWRTSAESAIRQIVLYWGGMNDRGMRCAPGVYRLLLNIEERKTSGKVIRRSLTGSAGVGR